MVWLAANLMKKFHKHGPWNSRRFNVFLLETRRSSSHPLTGGARRVFTLHYKAGGL